LVSRASLFAVLRGAVLEKSEADLEALHFLLSFGRRDRAAGGGHRTAAEENDREAYGQDIVFGRFSSLDRAGAGMIEWRIARF